MEEAQQELAEQLTRSDNDDGSCSPSSSSSEDLLSDDSDVEDEMAAKLESTLKENPYNYQAHVEYISFLRKRGLLEKVRIARELMSSNFPLNPAMWLEWTRDEAHLVSSDKDIAAVEKLYERAVGDYLSVQLWQEYLDFVRHQVRLVSEYTSTGVSKMRALYERALSASGLHYIEGMKLWVAYRQFEMDVLASMPESLSSEVKLKQIEHIRSLYRRQLSVPLHNTSSTLKEYVEWESNQGVHFGTEVDDDGVPQAIASSYHKVVEMCKVREIYEDKISKDKANNADLLQNFLSYIVLEEGTGDLARVQVFYERAIVEFAITQELWLKYLSFLENNLKVSSIIVSVYGRAVRNCPWTQSLWSGYLLALERANKCESDIRKVFEQSLQSGFWFSSAAEYLEHYLTRVDGIRRQVQATSDETDKIHLLTTLRETFNQSVQFLSTYFPNFVDRTFRLHAYWARLEACLAQDVSAARGVWENLIKSSGWMVEVWQGYIAFELSLGNLAEVRTLYKRCYSRRLEANGTEIVCESWLRFEREYGLLLDYDRALSKIAPRLAEVKQFQHEDIAKAAQGIKDSHPDKFKAGKQTMRKDLSSDQKSKSEPRKRSLGEIGTVQEGQKFEKKQKKAAEADRIPSEVTPTKPPEESTMREAKIIPENAIHYRDECTAFVSRFGPDITEKDLESFFSDCEGLREVRLMKHRATGKSRCFAYVDFMNEEGLAAAVAKHNQKFKGAKLKVERSNPSLARRKGAWQRIPNSEHNGQIEDRRESKRAIETKDTQVPEAKQAENKDNKKETTANAPTIEGKGGKEQEGKTIPILVHHHRGGHVQLTGKNTFAVPRSVVRQLGFSGGEAGKSDQEEPPKSNKDFRDMLLKR